MEKKKKGIFFWEARKWGGKVLTNMNSIRRNLKNPPPHNIMGGGGGKTGEGGGGGAEKGGNSLGVQC